MLRYFLSETYVGISDFLCHCRLAAQQEELEALRSSLKQVLHAKEEDLQLYSTMISQVKQVFLQALRQHKQSSKQET